VTITSERGEATSASARRALAHYRGQLMGDRRPSLGRMLMRDGLAPTLLTEKFHTHDAISRLVAIAEDFSLARLVDVVEEGLPRDEVVSLLWESELDRSGNTWEQREGLWKRFRGVRAADFSDHSALQGFVDARNAISHGLGSLTRKQLRSRTKVVPRLTAAGIRLSGTGLLLGADDVERCASVVFAFVEWLDGNA
jgi:hypothetical protein